MNIFWWGLGAVVAGGVIWLVKLIFLKPFNINNCFDSIMLQFALGNPEILSMLRVFERAGIYGHNKKLNDESDAFKKKQESKMRRALVVLQSYDQAKLSHKDRLSLSIMLWFIQDSVDGQRYSYHNYPINQLFGVQNQFPTFMVTLHQIKNKRDAHHYNVRLSKVGRKFAQVIEGLKIRAAMGIIPPTFVFAKVIDEMADFIKVPIEENILHTNLIAKIDKFANISHLEKEKLLKVNIEALKDVVYPAYRDLAVYLSELKDKSSSEDGVWKLPQGDDYYQYLLGHYTTTQLSAEEIHDIGLREVGRIHVEMSEIFGTLGYTGKSSIELINQLSAERRFMYEDTAEERRQVIVDYQEMINSIEQKISHLFYRQPKAKVVVDRIPEFKEKTAPTAYYYPPALDGSRPGIFSVNLMKMPIKFHMQTLAFHEAVPGHHFQLAIQQELKGVPMFRKFLPFTAYAEGWALYAEKLAYEEKLFSDKYAELGYLASELFRAVRLVVDTGLHHKRWTREEAIQYMTDNSGSSRSNIEAEIERYIVMPGQATAYKIGELEIVRLRKHAKDKLVAAFDIREFHNVVLKNGSVPLTILAQLVDRYIEANIAKK